MLKALELAGFKSFADKTRLDFGAGVTCVVGPNGSGKSNVVDAIKWVTGSQSAKALRGKEMTDVIFSGSATRRAMNAAEVTLEFDNASGHFDLASPTVRITRRVYRSGEGEYLLNGATTRLRDIRTLLAGTGVGAEAYSIIEQGRVDAMLRASPRDRRGIFEEAAGVSRFRLKKKEAAKRLARVEQNLLRLSDIVDEVEGRLRRVKKQAGKAQKYREASQRLKELRTTLGVADYRHLARRAASLQQDSLRLAEEHKQDARTLEAAELELTKLEADGASAGGKLAEIDRRLADLREQMGAARAHLASQQARELELQEELGHKQNRLRGVLAQAQHPEQAETTELSDQHAAAQAAYQQAQRLHDRAVTERDQAKAEFDALSQQQAQLGEELQQAETKLAELASAQEKSARRIKDFERQAERLNTKQQELAEESQRLQVAATQAKQHAQAAEQKLAENNALHDQLQQQTEQLRQQLATASQALADAQTQVIRLQHQAEAMQQMENDLQALRESLAASADGQWNVLGIVADVLHVDYDSAPMVEAALGDRAHHLVIDSGAALIDSLTMGRLTLDGRLCLERLDSQSAASVVDRVDLSGEPGVMGRADQFVDCEATFAPLVRRLLGRVWFVDTLATAERLAQGVGRGLGYVTYSGESLTADGILTVGPKSQARNLLTRKQQASSVAEELASAEQAVVRLADSIAELEQQVSDSARQATLALAQRTQSSDHQAEARHAWRNLEEQSKALQNKLRKATEQLASISAEQTSHQHGQQEHHATLQLAEQNVVAVRTNLQQIEPEVERTKQAWQLANEQAVAAQVELAGAQQRAEVLQTQWRQSQQGAGRQAESRQTAVQEVEDCRRRLTQCQLQQLQARAERDLLATQSESLVRRRAGAQQLVHQTQHRKTSISQAVRERRKLAETVLEQRRKREIELAQVEQQQATLCQRMTEDYSVDLATAAQEMPELPPVENRQELEDEIALLRGDVQSVGAVNLESIEELDDLESRFNELSAQYQDLAAAKQSLEQLTRRLSVETRKLFLSTIESVRGEFRELFRQLFGGGEADLVLVDGEGDDPLDAGIEIAAQPPGKDLSNITLLSGGEKTMTCVALLLALFRTKPSPFCVLDEVDAALDEANIGRFTGVLNEFLSSTQFIVITHSKRTMTGADTMYGITMQESGVSKQVSVRFEEVDEQGNIRTPGASERRAA